MVSINMLTEFLNYAVVSAPEDRHMRFDIIEPLEFVHAGYNVLPMKDKYPSAVSPLFMGSVEQAAIFLEAHDDVYVLVLMREGESISSLMKHSDRAIICSTDDDLKACYTKSNLCFMVIGAWVRELNGLVINGANYQDFIDCSDPVLGNFFTLTDSEFKLVAYSHSNNIDDKETSYLVEHGQHSTETIENFRKYDVMKHWSAQEQIELKVASPLNQYPTLDYVFHTEDEYSLHLNLHCNNTPPTPGLIDTLQILIDNLEHCVKRHWEDFTPVRQEVSSLFEQMLQSPPGFMSVPAKSLAERLGIPPTGNFTLYAWLFSDDPTERAYDPYHIHFLQDTFPGCFICEHDEYILMLDVSSTKIKERRAVVESFITEHECMVGISCVFHKMSDFVRAFQQATLAITLTRRPDQNMAVLFNPEYDEPVQEFSDHLLEYVVKTARENDPLIAFSAESSIVGMIAEYDKKHGTEDLKVLYHYLASNCKASTACEALFMHRSTLLYRINKMQERFDFDLDDYTTRLKITLGYLIIQQTEE